MFRLNERRRDYKQIVAIRTRSFTKERDDMGTRPFSPERRLCGPFGPSLHLRDFRRTCESLSE